MAAEGDPVSTPVAVKQFGKAVSTHLPNRLAQVRRIGRSLAANTNGKPKR